MTSDDAVRKAGSPSGDNSQELDQAIDELRGVLKKGDDEQDDEVLARRSTDRHSTGASKKESSGAGARPAGNTDDMSTASSKAFSDFGDDDTMERPDAGAPAGMDPAARMEMIMDIPIDVQIVLGTSRMPVSALMNLSEGSTIALARKIGEPVEITVNGRIIGHGEITVLDGDDSRFGVRLIDVVKAGGS